MKQKNIIFDISHPAHINLFKHSIYTLHNDRQYNVYVTCLRRGKLPLIAKEELKGINLSFVGKHRGTKLSIIFEANIRKFFELLFFTLRKKIHFGISAGSMMLGAALKITGKNNIQFDDDPERTKNVFLEKLTADVVYTPPIIAEEDNIVNFNALKEWAYLSPRYFNPNIEALSKYKLTSNNYLFIREVSTGSLNYSNQKSGLVLSFAHQIPKEVEVIISLEDKSLTEHYPKNWTILEEPVQDIHSLIYYSSLLISSGDSMAREGAQLGVPSIYCGFRDMKANKILVKENMLFELPPEEIPNKINQLIDSNINKQDEFRKSLDEKWDDLNELIMSNVKKYG